MLSCKISSKWHWKIVWIPWHIYTGHKGCIPIGFFLFEKVFIEVFADRYHWKKNMFHQRRTETIEQPTPLSFDLPTLKCHSLRVLTAVSAQPGDATAACWPVRAKEETQACLLGPSLTYSGHAPTQSAFLALTSPLVILILVASCLGSWPTNCRKIWQALLQSIFSHCCLTLLSLLATLLHVPVPLPATLHFSGLLLVCQRPFKTACNSVSSTCFDTNVTKCVAYYS